MLICVNMFLEIFSIFLILVRAAFSATAVCTFQTPCQCVFGAGQVIDLSTVGTPDHPRFYEILPENSTDSALYSYNPCYAFDSSDNYATVKEGNVPCKNAAACVRTPGKVTGDPPEEHAVGIQSTAIFQSDTDKSFHIFYDLQKKGLQNLTVILKCDNSTLHKLDINQLETPDNGSVIMTLHTKCACPPFSCASPTPDKSSHGLSTGSKLLIAFFTILLAYFLIGIVWNFCNGAHGMELIPNVDFWNELPKLIIEGVLFTCSCFGRKRSYGEVIEEELRCYSPHCREGYMGLRVVSVAENAA
ncbi:uncharacterized protein LOC129981074 isoform X2 [Argiope bruennichi]|uniref:uncharacterized protein LOC129981074 isoform X2 n=1 Tax=Argiope bruennichi TaxID=94029 RepID=UPI00249420ED|nr:uncharacterized protein LOC129981074 isoform X2 [Argiope bruennichi]